MQNRFMRMVAAVLMAGCLLASPAFAEGTSPETIVKQFAKAYFMLDETMGEYLSQGARVNENRVDMVDLYLKLRTQEARNRGYDISYFRMKPIFVKTKLIQKDDETARVAVEVDALRSINPLFRAAGWVFGLLKEHRFRDTVGMIKENGEWKVGPGAFDMPM